jgi:hypothetical protein
MASAKRAETAALVSAGARRVETAAMIVAGIAAAPAAPPAAPTTTAATSAHMLAKTVSDILLSPDLSGETKEALIAQLVRDGSSASRPPPPREDPQDETARMQAAVARRIGRLEHIVIDEQMANAIAGGHMPEGELKQFVAGVLTAKDPVGVKAAAGLRQLKPGVPCPAPAHEDSFNAIGREVVWRMLIRLASAMEAEGLRNKVQTAGMSFEKLQEALEVQCDPTNLGALQTLKAISSYGKQTSALGTVGSTPNTPQKPNRAHASGMGTPVSIAKRPREEALRRC